MDTGKYTQIEKSRDKWRITAIISLIILILSISFVGYVYSIGKKSIDNEIKCSNEICFNVKATSFIYDDASKTCSCYDVDKIIHKEILK